ncbi:hypothetical protein NU195Hw_g4907t1 [Hortaea werneckii]
MLLLRSLVLLFTQIAFTVAGPLPRYANSTIATEKAPTSSTAPGSNIHANIISSISPITTSSGPSAQISALPESVSDIRAWEQNADVLPTSYAAGPGPSSFTGTEHHWHFTYDPISTPASSSQLAVNATAFSSEALSFTTTSSSSLDSITSAKESSASYQHTTFRFEPNPTNATVLAFSSQLNFGMSDPLRTETSRTATCSLSYLAASTSLSDHGAGTTSASEPAVYGSLTLTYHVSSDSATASIVLSSSPSTTAGETSRTSSTTVQQLAPWTQSSDSISTASDYRTQTQTSWRFSYMPTMTTTTTSSFQTSTSSLQHHQQGTAEDTSKHSQVTSTSHPATASDGQNTTRPSHDLPDIVTEPPSSISSAGTSSTSSASAKAGIVIVPVDPHAVTVTVTTTTTEKEFGATNTLLKG